MDITTTKAAWPDAKEDAIVIGVFEGEDITIEEIRERAMSVAKKRGFTGKLGECMEVNSPDAWKADVLLIVGLGARAKFDANMAREATGNACATLRGICAKRAAFALFGEGGVDVDVKVIAAAMCEAALSANYGFDVYKKANGEKRLTAMTIVCADRRNVARIEKPIARASAIMDGVSIARDLVNTPAQNMTPSHIAEAAERVAKTSGKTVKVKILNREQCEKLKMGAYLGVAQGSMHEPKFIHLTYTPERSTKKVFAVVGKGITFDSGGLSLKPADSMMTMKCDMSGAAAVIGLFATLAALRPRVVVHGIIAAAENMPSGAAYRPGDILRASNGKTIEVANTDAEGRLTLADALLYALKLKPNAVVDLATLTGACMVALGEEMTAVMGNDDALITKILDASKRAGEKMWQLPLEENYRKLNDSDVADVRNIPSTRYGGAITAGLFLSEFVDNTPWAHLDIAGPAFAERPLSSYIGKGGTGHGVRTLVELVERF